MKPTLGRTWAIVGLGLLTATCVKPDPDAFCDANHPCPSGQSCDLVTRLCILPSPPTVTIDQPQTNAMLSGSTFHLAGRIGSPDGRSIMGAQVRLGAVGDWNALPLRADGSFEADLPLPAIDNQLMKVSVRAADSLIDATGSVYPTVDTVAPTATLTPASGDQTAAPVVNILFSEPIAEATEIPLVLTPAAGPGRWNADRTAFQYPTLAPDTRYQATLLPGAVTDAAGHRNASGMSSTFVTLPAAPPSGSVLSFNLSPIADFEVASDADGVMTIAAVLQTTPQTVAWGVFSPKTGRFEEIGTAVANNLAVLQAVAARLPTPDGPARRTQGILFEWQQPGVGTTARSAWWRSGANPVQTQPTGVLALVPVPGACGENAPDTVGLALQPAGAPSPLFRRAGLPDVALSAGFTPHDVAASDPNTWEWFDPTNGTLQRQVRTCTCGPEGSCGFSAPELVRSDLSSTDPQLSLALTPAGRRLYVFNTAAGTRTEACYDCGGSGVGSPCTLGGEQASAPLDGLVVASEQEGGKVVGARATDNSIELIERDLSAGCTGAWTQLGLLANPSTVIKYRPVHVGNRPGLLYLTSGDNAIHLLVP